MYETVWTALEQLGPDFHASQSLEGELNELHNPHLCIGLIVCVAELYSLACAIHFKYC